MLNNCFFFNFCKITKLNSQVSEFTHTDLKWIYANGNNHEWKGSNRKNWFHLVELLCAAQILFSRRLNLLLWKNFGPLFPTLFQFILLASESHPTVNQVLDFGLLQRHDAFLLSTVDLLQCLGSLSNSIMPHFVVSSSCQTDGLMRDFKIMVQKFIYFSTQLSTLTD